VPAATEAVTFNTPGAVVSVDADTTIKMIRVYAPATLNLNSPLHIANVGLQGTDIRADLVINGPSTLDFSRNGTSTTDLLDLFVRSDATWTVNAKLTGASSGIETWTTGNFMTGTYVFNNPDNDFPNVVTIVRGGDPLSSLARPYRKRLMPWHRQRRQSNPLLVSRRYTAHHRRLPVHNRPSL
jgi:hypothetical protein